MCCLASYWNPLYPGPAWCCQPLQQNVGNIILCMLSLDSEAMKGCEAS